MPQEIPRTGISADLEKQLQSEEKLYFYAPTYKPGCLGLDFLGGGGDFWCALTEKRFLYHSNVQEITGYVSTSQFGTQPAQQWVEREGILPIKKITSMEIAEFKPGCGCVGFLQKSRWTLRVNAQGAIIAIPLLNKKQGLEIRTIFHELTDE